MRVSRLQGVLLLSCLVIAGVAMVTTEARSQVNATPSWLPIGVSASGNSSTAWFHEPYSRQAVACRTVEGSQGGVASVQCVSGKLP